MKVCVLFLLIGFASSPVSCKQLQKPTSVASYQRRMSQSSNDVIDGLLNKGLDKETGGRREQLFSASSEYRLELEGLRGSWKYYFMVLFRAIYLLLSYLPVICCSGLAYLSETFRDFVWFPLLQTTVAHSGAAFIKWGQWASTRSDMFPESLCDQLSRLHSDAPTHSLQFTRQQIRAELGGELESVFDAFDTTPIASGSIAQVYRAVYRQKVVAVKVRHPNVEEQIMIDFDIMLAMAHFVESLPGMGWLNLKESMAQFSHTIAAQTDLVVEGKHLHMFIENFRKWPNYRFPEPILATHSVLVETFLEGESVSVLINDMKNGRGDPHLNREAAHFTVTKGEDLYLKMLLQDNLMHADLHPGNILLRMVPNTKRTSWWQSVTPTITGGNTGRNDYTPEALTSAAGYVSAETQAMLSKQEYHFQISLVDAGMVAELSKEEKENFIGLIEAMGEGFGREAADYVLRFSRHNFRDASSSGPTPNSYNDYATATTATTSTAVKAKAAAKVEMEHRHENFRAEMDALFRERCRGYGTNTDLGHTLRGVLHLIRIHRITIEANYATLVMNALCLDSLAKALLPTYNVLDNARLLLRLNRRGKRLPFGLSSLAIKKLFPTLQRLKQGMDNKFLRDLQRLPKIPLMKEK